MSMSNFKETDLLSFLRTMSQKGMFPPNTASALIVSVTKVLSVLNEQEKNNLNETLDLNDVIARFGNKSKHDFTPGSLTTYGKRFKKAFKEYIIWSKDPANYRPKTKIGRPQKTKQNTAQKKSSHHQPNAIITGKTTHSPATEIESSHPIPTIKYPLVTGGSLEIPKSLDSHSIEKLIPVINAIIKSHEFNNLGN